MASLFSWAMTTLSQLIWTHLELFLDWVIFACVALINVVLLAFDQETLDITTFQTYARTANHYVPVAEALAICLHWLAFRAILTIIRVILHVIP